MVAPTLSNRTIVAASAPDHAQRIPPQEFPPDQTPSHSPPQDPPADPTNPPAVARSAAGFPLGVTPDKRGIERSLESWVTV
jgi:hypothetical protein